MDYGKEQLKEKVDGYIEGDISKEELGKWAECAYFDLLKGGYVENKKIAIYPFLKIISKIHIESDELKDEHPCMEEDIKSIQAVLQGKSDYDFQVEMAIPVQMQNVFCERGYLNKGLIDLIFQMKNNAIMFLENNSKEITEIARSIQMYSNTKTKKQCENVISILENKILKMYGALFEENAGNSIKKQNMWLYTGKMTRNIGITKLMEYLDCYIGKKSFGVIVSYRNGFAEVVLIV